MEYLIYVAFALVVLVFIIAWIWIMRKVATAAALLNNAAHEIEIISIEVEQVAQEVVEITDELEQAQLYEKTCPKTRRETDRQDN